MIVWSGRGFLIVVMLLGIVVLGIKFFPDEYSGYAIIIAIFTSSVFSWHFGYKWNNTRILRDEETGQKIILEPNHSLFWIKMQHWGIILGVWGTSILAHNSIWASIISGLILLIMVLSRYLSKNRNNKNLHTKIKQSTTKVKVDEIKKTEVIETDIEKEIRIKEKEDPSRFIPK